MSDDQRSPLVSERCEGRYPVPQTSPPRDEPFEVTYRCALALGHEGPHGSGADIPAPVSEDQGGTALRERAEKMYSRADLAAVAVEAVAQWQKQRARADLAESRLSQLVEFVRHPLTCEKRSIDCAHTFGAEECGVCPCTCGLSRLIESLSSTTTTDKEKTYHHGPFRHSLARKRNGPSCCYAPWILAPMGPCGQRESLLPSSCPSLLFLDEPKQRPHGLLLRFAPGIDTRSVPESDEIPGTSV
jgi:hypothetical protein